MPNELELGAIAAAVGALLGGVCTGIVVHKIDGAVLAHEKAAHADDIARINATAADQLAQAIAKQQAYAGQVQTLQQQYQDEVSQHAKDSLSYRAQLLAGTQRVRVHVTPGSCSGSHGQGTATASGTDDAAPVADLSPAVAAGVYAVVDSADSEAIKLRALQEYVRKLQDAGYISK